MPLKLILSPLYWAGRLVGAVWRRLGAHVATTLHRAVLAELGRGSVVQAGVRFSNPGIVRIGAECLLWRGVDASAELGEAPLIIADAVQINQDVHLDTTGGLSIGARTLISEDVVIYTHDHGLDPRSAPQQMPKTIANDVWIGMRATILPGCQQIGAGAVIGAGAIVTRDVPEGVVVAGNPARIVAHRPSIAKVAA
ncbi:acyltransferase [Cognatiyoonia sp. IB215446]|uniref:acyltransferase n=1 Tax=Cognatiyoonia sp. IB215446 TaxID=3097355 RepID=UPI002A0BC796|nr:acyltransferase [Cognatiyoonia sp. IB215446]MDX8347926.1 acyltransferase [Cognatiyoonia sp. IB215446]